MNVSGAFLFLIDTLFQLYTSIVLARFILQMVRADFYNPISQFIVKATNPVLIPLRRIVPGFGGLDIASLVLFVALIAIKLVLLIYISGYEGPVDPLAFVLTLLREGASTILNFFLYVIFIAILLSWIVAASGSYNPLADILNQIAEPLLGPARKVIPPLGGLDISPMLVIFGILFMKQLFGL